jgi:hypothetical protein
MEILNSWPVTLSLRVHERNRADAFTSAVTPDLTAYAALRSDQPLNELNPAKNGSAQASLELDPDRVDAAEEESFNRILWSLIKGQQPYPGTRRISSLEVARAH